MASSVSLSQIAQANAFQRAEHEAERGNRPALIGASLNDRGILCETWTVASRTSEGHEYGVWLREMPLSGHIGGGCDCKAGQAGKQCWHVSAATLAHQDRIAFENRAGFRLRLKRQGPAITAAMLSGKV
jgi:hypothetical protein